MKIAVSGKGGVGKTTIAVGLVRAFARLGRTVYAVDADPDANLGFALGFPEELLVNQQPIAEMKELVRERTGDGSFFVINPRVDDVIDRYSLTDGMVRFLRMGGVKKGGTECYCRENAFLNAFLNALLLGHSDVVVLDMSAGIEPLSRGTARGVDLMLVVVEPGRASLRTGQIVAGMAAELGIKCVRFIANKVRSLDERDIISASLGKDRILGFVSFNDELLEGGMNGTALPSYAGKTLEEVEEIRRKILAEAGDRVA